jgi:hypothetical protein
MHARLPLAAMLSLLAFPVAASDFISTTFGSTAGGEVVYITATATIGCYIAERESFLVPLQVDGVRGFGGSSWSTELWVHNGNAVDVSLRPKICSSFIGLHECGGDPLLVPAGNSRRIPLGSGGVWTEPAPAIFEMPEVRRAERVRVEIEALPNGIKPLWAMVSVTDNVTQHVTIITPSP